MIKLEELKKGDKIYGVTLDGLGLYAESIVDKELSTINAYPKGFEAVTCEGGLELVTRLYEEYLFRSEQEAEEKLNELQLKMAKDLLASNKFVDRLFECATSSKRLSRYSEEPIYKIAIKLYKDGLSQ